jgi:hypothetical protein
MRARFIAPGFRLIHPGLFALAEHLRLIDCGEVCEPSFRRLTGFLQCLRRFHVILVALEADQLGVDQRVVDVPMTK